MPRRAGGSVVVTGIGMNTPLGQHAAQSAASVRAGLNLFRQWPYFGVDLGEDSGLSASFLESGPGDEPWVAKAHGLLRHPLAEALGDARVWDLEKLAGRARAWIATPYPDREGVTAEAFEEMTTTLGEDLFEEEVSLPLELVALEHAGGLVAMAQAVEVLLARKADLCLVGGVDSLLESTFLQTLFVRGRLKAGKRPSGLLPGEGAAFLVLERAEDARQRRAPPLASVDAIAVERDAPYESVTPIRAEGLSRALRAVLAATGPEQIRRVLTDLNGERWRFLEWAVAETRCLDQLPRDRELWHPADCLGDVGAAFGPLAVALAARAFARGYHGDGKVLIAASSDRGERAALCLSAPRKGDA